MPLLGVTILNPTNNVKANFEFKCEPVWMFLLFHTKSTTAFKELHPFGAASKS